MNNLHINQFFKPEQVIAKRCIARDICGGKATEDFLKRQDALDRVAPLEIDPVNRNLHGDIIYGKAVTSAHKNGWCLVGNRFTTSKHEAIEHTKRLDRILRG